METEGQTGTDRGRQIETEIGADRQRYEIWRRHEFYS